jgi:hypothetical protein
MTQVSKVSLCILDSIRASQCKIIPYDGRKLKL